MAAGRVTPGKGGENEQLHSLPPAICQGRHLAGQLRRRPMLAVLLKGD